MSRHPQLPLPPSDVVRLTVLRIALPLMAVLIPLSMQSLRHYGHLSDTLALILRTGALAFLVMGLLVWIFPRSTRHISPVTLGALCVMLGAQYITEFINPATALDGPALITVAFMAWPLIYVFSYALLSPANGFRFNLYWYAMQLGLMALALSLHSDALLAHPDFPHLLIWMIFISPVLVAMLQSIPGFQKASIAAELALEASTRELETARQIAEVKALHQRAADSARVGVWDWEDITLDEMRWSGTCRGLLGLPPSDNPMLLSTARSLMHPEDVDRVFAQLDRHVRQNQSLNIDLRMQHATEGYRWFNISGDSLRDPRGISLKISGILMDIHDRVIAAQALAEAQEKLRQLAFTDSLTGLMNRRRFEQRLQEEWQKAAENQEWMTLALIDVDYFKQINDNFGHARGDEVLQQIGQLLTRCADRPGYRVGRWAGDEFVMFMRGANAAEGRLTLTALQQALASSELNRAGDRPITLSIGMSSLRVSPQAALDVKGWMQRCDIALYEAKNAGRNRLHQADTLSDVSRRRP